MCLCVCFPLWSYCNCEKFCSRTYSCEINQIHKQMATHTSCVTQFLLWFKSAASENSDDLQCEVTSEHPQICKDKQMNQNISSTKYKYTLYAIKYFLIEACHNKTLSNVIGCLYLHFLWAHYLHCNVDHLVPLCSLHLLKTHKLKCSYNIRPF